MNNKILFPAILLFLIIGCKNSMIRENSPEDIKEATDFVRNFYRIVGRNQIDSASVFFSNSFGVEDGKSVINQVKHAIGDLVETEITLVRTTYKEQGSSVQKDYGLEIKTKYSNGSATEQISLKNENNSLKIDGYHVKVDP